MNKKNTNLPRGILDGFSNGTGVSKDNISAVLSGLRNIGKKTALSFEKTSTDLGYDFSASDWMFSPQKIRQQLIENHKEDEASA